MYHGAAGQRSSPRQTPSSPHQHSPRASSIRHILQPTPDHQSWSHGRPPHYGPKQPTSPTTPHEQPINGYDVQRHDKAPGTYYDPTSEYRERRPSLSGGPYASQSPQAHQKSLPYTSPRPSERHPYDSSQPSPASTYQSHQSPVSIPPPSRGHASAYGDQQPPQSPTHNRSMMMAPPPSATKSESRPPPAPSARSKDPMSFSNILSSSEPEPPPPATPAPALAVPAVPTASVAPPQQQPVSPKVPVKRSRDVDNHVLDQRPVVDDRRHTPEPTPIPAVSQARVLREDEAKVNGTPKAPIPEATFKSPIISASKAHFRTSSSDRLKVNGEGEPLGPGASRANKGRVVISEKEVQAALARIEAMDSSDIDEPEFDRAREEYANRTLKRLHQLTEIETAKRKRRRVAQITKLSDNFDRQALAAKERYLKDYEKAAWERIQSQEVADEKERKKIMQRNRRRETTKTRAEAQAAEYELKAQQETDPAEKARLQREAERFNKKASATGKLLKGETPNKDFRETTPMAPNQSGGVMSSFQVGDDGSQEPAKKRPRTGGRLKKSKEKKQAEKDAAAAAHAAIERGDELVAIAPKVEAGKELPKKITLTTKDTDATERSSASSSKAYDQLYEQIWRDIARKDIPKIVRVKDSSLSTKQSNLRKTAQLASKEARRWQLKTNKSTKDIQARAKRVMREMLSFWKRNEREERDQRKFAEKQELENAKKAEAEREANRQRRKLNFLISQTELYSHFIGKKVKTAEAEKSTEDVAVSDTTVVPGPADAATVDLPDGPAAKVTKFEDLDFDAEDDSVLQEAAMASAQNAIHEAQERAKNFNTEGGIQAQFDDEGEMNFQNPTSLQNMDISQPKMLECQLKEYQLKGLNWLVNLYEQGINGILADEMGLGKTVQSIAVMAYLAEMHNIWGPFLVIAPSSTLHNWQQEIKRFVPGLTVLPYWGNAKDRKVLRKFWDRKHITYRKESPFHVMVTSYQLVVQDAQYFQKIRWQYMVLDEAQAIKSSQSSRWKSLLGFHCRNRLLLTGTPIQNNMQELWALLHFIMPSLFDSHDEFSDWFSKDIESHAQSNTKLNEDQLKRLHMILKPFMLRRIKKHVQKELGDKIEEDVFCDLTYRQRAYYGNLRNKISIMDLIEKATVGDDQDTATLMNLVMQFRKVCNHPDLFERAETMSPVQFAYFAETASFLREGHNIDVLYSVRNLIEYQIPRLIGRGNGRLDIAGPDNDSAGWRGRYLYHLMNIWKPENILESSMDDGAFSFLRFTDHSAGEASAVARMDVAQRAISLQSKPPQPGAPDVFDDDEGYESATPAQRLFMIVDNKQRADSAKTLGGGALHDLMNISGNTFDNRGMHAIEPCSRPAATAPPIELYCASQGVINERRRTFFNVPVRKALFGVSEKTELSLLDSNVDPNWYPVTNMLPDPISDKARWTKIQVPSMRRFVTDSGKLARLDRLLGELKSGGHRVLIYFQMTRMIDLMEEYLAYRNYKYCRLDGSTKLEDRRDTVAEFQTNPEIFVFLLSTRAGGLGINLTAADTVIFYDSDWNPTIDSQAMDRAHRLGQTRQVTVYRMITRSTIEERIRRRALQKEEVQRVVIQGGAGAQVDFNTRSRENRTKDIAMWLADDDQAAEIEKKEAEIAEKEAKEPNKTKKKAGGRKKTELSLDDMYHEGEGHFEDSGKPSGTATPIGGDTTPWSKGNSSKRKGISKKAKSVREKLAIVDGGG